MFSTLMRNKEAAPTGSAVNVRIVPVGSEEWGRLLERKLLQSIADFTDATRAIVEWGTGVSEEDVVSAAADVVTVLASVVATVNEDDEGDSDKALGAILSAVFTRNGELGTFSEGRVLVLA